MSWIRHCFYVERMYVPWRP